MKNDTDKNHKEYQALIELHKRLGTDTFIHLVSKVINPIFQPTRTRTPKMTDDIAFHSFQI